MSKIAEPTTALNRAEKSQAYLQVASMIDDLLLGGIIPSEARMYLGVPNPRIKQLVSTGELGEFECDGSTYIDVDSVTALLIKWASELEVESESL